MSDYTLRLAVVAGASRVLKYKEENPHSTDREALKHVTENADSIAKEIEDD